MTTPLNQAKDDEVWLVLEPERILFCGTLLSTERYSTFDGTTCVYVYGMGDDFYTGVGWTRPI